MINDYDSEGNMVYNYMSLSDMLEPYYPYRNNSSDHIDLNEYARQRGLNNDDDDEDEDSFERLPASELSRDPNIDEREPEEEQAPRRLPYLEPEEEPMCDDEA